MILVYGEEEKIIHGNSNAQCERKHTQPPGANKKTTRLGLFRAGDGTRTHDLLLGKETFYQLNHARSHLNDKGDFT